MGTPAFALPTLKALHDAGHEIVAVYSQPPRPAGRGQKETPSPVHHFASGHDIPIYTPVSLKSPEAQAEFAAHKADAAIVAAYGLLLPQAILDLYPLGCINVHPSLLPRWRGAAPIQRTLMAGDTETGICIMQMDAGLDTGDILLQERYFVDDFTDAGMLHDELAFAAGSLVLQTLDRFKNGTIKPVKQPCEGVTYAKKITKQEYQIDWSMSAKDIRNKIRGLSPSPGAYFMHQGEAIKILSAGASAVSAEKYFGNVIPGTVIDTHCVIACGGGLLVPYEMKRPGKNRMFVRDILKGFAIPPGTVFE